MNPTLEKPEVKYPKPPRPVFTENGGFNPVAYLAYTVDEANRTLTIVYPGYTLNLTGKPAAFFLHLMGDARTKLFE
jgi:hypothetical protein